MKFIHIADTHLGAKLHTDKFFGEERSNELWESFSNIIDITEKENVDLLLIAGDMFHRQPLMRELKEVNYLFSKLTKAKVVFIVGNHDYIKHDSYYNTFKWNENVTCLKSNTIESIYISELNTEIYGLSYYDREVTKPIYDTVKPNNPKHINILLGHGGDDRHIPFNKNNMLNSQFDYIAMGHIHKPQVIIENKMLYSGALEPVDVNDIGVHGFVVGEISKKSVNIQFIKSALREYKHLYIKSDSTYTNTRLSEEIAQSINIAGANNLFKIIIEGYKDEDIVYNIENIYKIGNIVSVEDNSKPDYDFEKLSQLNKNNIIGKFINNMSPISETKAGRKALYYGVKALLDETR